MREEIKNLFKLMGSTRDKNALARTSCLECNIGKGDILLAERKKRA